MSTTHELPFCGPGSAQPCQPDYAMLGIFLVLIGLWCCVLGKVGPWRETP